MAKDPTCGMTVDEATAVYAERSGQALYFCSDLRGIAKAIRLSRATMRNVRQNVLFALLYNAPGIPVAAGVLYPFFGLAETVCCALGLSQGMEMCHEDEDG